MKPVGRIVARGKVAGLYLPFDDSLDGLYDMIDVFGEITLRRVGEPAIKRTQFTGLDLEGLMNMRPLSVMTASEYAETRKGRVTE